LTIYKIDEKFSYGLQAARSTVGTQRGALEPINTVLIAMTARLLCRCPPNTQACPHP
jgi:hypothetical protein